MITYQDLLAEPEDEKSRADFVRRVINEHKTSSLYLTAKTADEYDRCRNTTTMNYQKYITDITGRKYADAVSAVHRSCSNFLNIFVTQLNQYLLGNGASFKGAAKLGDDFDIRLQQCGKYALLGGVSFGFWNLDHLECFPVYSRDNGSFAPLADEEMGGIAAGVRFWQIDDGKPLRGTLYELDGYTDYMWISGGKVIPEAPWVRIDDGTWAKAKQPYKVTVTSAADGTESVIGENYPGFPIVPLYGNPHKQSELVGLREKIDAYDFILNGWEDDLDNAQIYWIISGAGGMDDPDLRQFLDRLRTVGAAAPGEGQDVSPVTVQIPVEARERLLVRLEKQLYRDAMIMNPEDIANGAATATQIRAAYERQNVKADQFEYCVLDFISGIMKIAGITDEVSFDRSTIINRLDEISAIVQAGSYLPGEYITRKLVSILGDADKANEVIRMMDAEDMERLKLTGANDAT